MYVEDVKGRERSGSVIGKWKLENAGQRATRQQGVKGRRG